MSNRLPPPPQVLPPEKPVQFIWEITPQQAKKYKTRLAAGFVGSLLLWTISAFLQVGGIVNIHLAQLLLLLSAILLFLLSCFVVRGNTRWVVLAAVSGLVLWVNHITADPKRTAVLAKQELSKQTDPPPSQQASSDPLAQAAQAKPIDPPAPAVQDQKSKHQNGSHPTVKPQARPLHTPVGPEDVVAVGYAPIRGGYPPVIDASGTHDGYFNNVTIDTAAPGQQGLNLKNAERYKVINFSYHNPNPNLPEGFDTDEETIQIVHILANRYRNLHPELNIGYDNVFPVAVIPWMRKQLEKENQHIDLKIDPKYTMVTLP